MATLRIPLATYRLQFNGQFRFEHARALVGYFDDLGVTDIYSSPLLQARRGSRHGYDVTDPTHLNSEIGSEQEFEGLAAELQATPHGPASRHRTQPHGRRQRESLVDGRAGRRSRLRLRIVF